MKLHGYWRSSASYRVRLALHFKQLAFEYHSIHLVKDGGEQHQPGYRELNGIGLVPTLEDGDVLLNQSLAIMDYLDHQYPKTPSVLPKVGILRSEILAFSYDLAMDLQPITNLRILQKITDPSWNMAADKQQWISHWVTETFKPLEEKLQATSGLFCFGDNFTLADICLLPQIYNAQRFNVDLSQFPGILAISQHCDTLSYVALAYPDNQPDAS